MSANQAPIFVGTPRVSYIATGTAANTALDGTGTVATVLTAGSNGSKIDKVIIEAMGSNVATVVRLFVNNGSSNAVATNNALVYEAAIAANSVSQTAISIRSELPLDLVLPATYKLNCTIGTAVATGLMVTAVGGDY